MQEELSWATRDRTTDPRRPPSQGPRWRVRTGWRGEDTEPEGGGGERERALIYIPTLVMRVNSLVKD